MVPFGSRLVAMTCATVLIVPDEPSTDCQPNLRYSNPKSSILFTALWRARWKFSGEMTPPVKN